MTVSEPIGVECSPITAVILNSGFQRRSGPNRSSVEVARRWAARGVRSVRIDFAGIGDSDGHERELAGPLALYQPRFVRETHALLEYLRDNGLGVKFVVVGHCSGAYWGLHTAARDPSVIGVFALDLWTLAWSSGLHHERMRERIAETIRAGTLQRMRDRGLSRAEIGQVARVLAHRVRTGYRTTEETRMARYGASILAALRDHGTQVVMLVVRNSRIPGQLRAAELQPDDGSWPNLQLVSLPSDDHLLRAGPLQHLVGTALDDALETVLQRETCERRLTARAR